MLEDHKLHLGLMLLGLAVASLAAAGLALAMPIFVEAFVETNLVPSGFSRAVLRGYPIAFVAPLAVLAVWRFWPNRRQRELACLLCGVAGALCSLALVVAALYLPIRSAAAVL